MKSSAVAVILAGVVAAQSSVVSIFFPDVDEQQLVGSIVSSDASKTTIAVSCPTGTDDTDCGFADTLTVTVGPSTFRVEETFESLTVELECALTGTTAATCEETYVGPAYMIDSDQGDSAALTATALDDINTQITTTAVTTTLSSTDIVFLPVTITAGPGSGAVASASASASASPSASTASTTAAISPSTHGGTSSGGPSTTTSGSTTPSVDSNSGAGKVDARLLAVSAAGVGLVGLIVTLL
ncbi:hypothetical protein A1O1_02567 [Capronia coronata CBS 617.96]|uniref:Uncharacterized protein n=1 Tax=Capronia coronata CBS 617.96 TaxID=1182541 RepID=W9ZI38_9EURO|nr:uncharacterized protein A1O1_02567 [Capronia coronata CBS 617.96]EXJ94174.1 hypothetical protein A1O1_02567 [Capronia coronata CBS 617.96]